MSSKASPNEIAQVIRHALRPHKHSTAPTRRETAPNAILTAAVLEAADRNGMYTGDAGAMKGLLLECVDYDNDDIYV